MPYKVRLVSPAEREATIRASVAASTRTEDFYDFRDQRISLKVIRISIDLPIYRMENFRTFIDQKEYTVRERKPANYFQLGQENESVQQLQHEILAKLARKGVADSIVPVLDVLKRERQREPLLITHKGVVVNGNRRLAAMRDLYADESETYPEFSHVDCMVLPEDASPKDLVDIEAGLQGRPETKLDYDWIGDCQLISKLLSFGETVPQIAERLNRKQSEIRNSLQALAEADTYLKDWAKAEGEYSRVRDAEQFFKDLPGLLQGKDSQLQEISRAIAWTLFDNREKLEDRLYAFNIAFGKRAADVADRLADNLGIPLEGSATDEKDDFDLTVDYEDSAVSYEPVIDVLRDPQRREQAVETLIDVCRGVIESERDQKSGNAALKAVTAAHAKLNEVDLTRATPQSYPAIGKQLDAIVTRATELKARLANYTATKSSSSPDTE